MRGILKHMTPVRRSRTPVCIFPCAICRRAFKREESVQLACSHRCHRECMIRMRERNRYECDICEVKQRKQCSISSIGRRGGVSPLGRR